MMIALVAFATVGAQNMQRERRGHGQRMDPQKMIEHRVNILDKELALTADQKAAITAIYTAEVEARKAQMPKMDKSEKPAKPDREAMKTRHEQMKAQQAEVDQKVVALLNAEQKAKYEQIKAKRDKMGPRGGRGHGPSPEGDKKAEKKSAKCNESADCCKSEVK